MHTSYRSDRQPGVVRNVRRLHMHVTGGFPWPIDHKATGGPSADVVVPFRDLTAPSANMLSAKQLSQMMCLRRRSAMTPNLGLHLLTRHLLKRVLATGLSRAGLLTVPAIALIYLNVHEFKHRTACTKSV